MKVLLQLLDTKSHLQMKLPVCGVTRGVASVQDGHHEGAAAAAAPAPC